MSAPKKGTKDLDDGRTHTCIKCCKGYNINEQGDEAYCGHCLKIIKAKWCEHGEIGIEVLKSAKVEQTFKGNQAPVGYIPAVMLFEVGKGMKDGADKHGGPFNWRTAPDTQKVMYHCNAAISHVLQFIEGEDAASDSGVSHLGHACAQLAIALDKLKYRPETDDRPNKGKK